MRYQSNCGLRLAITREETRRDLPKPRGKQTSPWGIHKTRCTLQSNRIDKMLARRPRVSPMTMRYFNNLFSRFNHNWNK